jgi:hypothetical protein
VVKLNYFLVAAVGIMSGCNASANVMVETNAGILPMSCTRYSHSINPIFESFEITHSNQRFLNMPIIAYIESESSRSLTVYDKTNEGYSLEFRVSESSALNAVNDCKAVYSSWDNAL